MQSEMQELIAAAAEILKCAYIEGSGWELGERLRDAIIAARASEGGWIEIKKGGPRPTGWDHLLLYLDGYGIQHQCVGYFNRLARMWFVDGECQGSDMAVTHYRELPSPPLSIEKPNEVRK